MRIFPIIALLCACSAPADPDAGVALDAGSDAGSDAGKDAGMIDAGEGHVEMRDGGRDAGSIDAGSIDAGAGMCVGACNEIERAREPRECFNETEASDLDYLRSIAMTNGTMCPGGSAISGFRLYRDGGCIRMDRYYCPT